MNKKDIKTLAKLLGLAKSIFEISRGRLEMKIEYVCDVEQGRRKYIVHFWDIIGDKQFSLESMSAEESCKEAMSVIHEDYAYMMVVCGEHCATSCNEYEKIFTDLFLFENMGRPIRHMRLLFNSDVTSAYLNVFLGDNVCPVQALIKKESGWFTDSIKEKLVPIF